MAYPTVAGGTPTARLPISTTARRTPVAPMAPGTMMAQSYAAPNQSTIQAPPTPQSILSMPYRDGRLANRQLYQSDLTAARGITDPAARQSALQAAYQASQARYQNLGRGYTGDLSPFAFNAQDYQPGLEDVRSQAPNTQAPAATQPAPMPTRYPAAMQRPGTQAPQMPQQAAPQMAQQPQQPGAYPQGIPSIFQPRDTSGIPNRSAGPYGGPQQNALGQQAIQGYQAAQQALLGPLAGVFGLNPNSNFTLTRGDVPLLEAGLNFENIALAERDRGLGYGELSQGLGAIGSDPQSQRLKQILGYQAEGNQSPELMQALQLASQRAGRANDTSSQVTATRNQYNRETENALRELQGDYARRGIAGGNEGMLNEALLRQEGGFGLARALAELEARQDEAQRFDIEQLGSLAGQRDQGRQTALEQLRGQLGQEEQSRSAFSQALANVFLETEREPFDLSSLTTPLKDKISGLPVAGPSKIKLTKRDVPKNYGGIVPF